jgi:CRP-like cAMP-binding protein
VSAPARAPAWATSRSTGGLAQVTLPDDLEPSPDRDGAHPRLTAEQIAAFARNGTPREVAPSDTLFREGDVGYDFFAVVAGTVAVVENLGRDSQQVVAVHGPGGFV